MTSIFNHPWFSSLFADANIQSLWSAETQGLHYRKFEIALVQALEKHGLVASGLGQKAATQIMDAPVTRRVFWCKLGGLVAIPRLLVTGLNALQGAAVSTGNPLTLVMLVMFYCLWIWLKHERHKI